LWETTETQSRTLAWCAMACFTAAFSATNAQTFDLLET